MSAIEILDRLIAFDTVSAKSNLDLMAFVQDYLSRHGVTSELIPNAEKTKASLYATIGPQVPGGIVLSGHTDVVPVEGQDWSSDPFTLTERSGLLHGRGTADMKGFLAAVLSAVPDFVAAKAPRPVHLAFSYDEEIGCLGVRPMLNVIAREKPLPAIAIVGEPTSMTVVNAHKGIRSFLTRVTGLEAHSSRTHEGVSAILAAAQLILFLESVHDALKARGDPTGRFSPPHTTISVGTIMGGTAMNIIPKTCSFEWECRCLPGDDDTEVVDRFNAYAENTVLPAMRERAPGASIETLERSRSPGLMVADGSPAEELVLRLAQQNAVHAVSYATEAGLFQHTGIPAVVCGPGDIAQAHKPNEFLSMEQLKACEAFLLRLRDALAA